MKKSLTLTFWILIGVFLFIISQFFIPAVTELFKGLVFLLPFAVFCILGIVLIFLTIKQKVKGTLKKFLLLTGACATGFFISVFLHNMFYALGIMVGHITVLKYLMEFIHMAFFLIAIFICPLGFLVGVVGSIVMFVKEKE